MVKINVEYKKLPPQSNIYGQSSEFTIRVKSQNGLSSDNLQPHLLILGKGGSEWQWIKLAFFNLATIVAVKSFIVQASGQLGS